jgi:PAS domain S-box-containing protein
VSLFVREDTQTIEGWTDLTGRKVAVGKLHVGAYMLADRGGIDLVLTDDVPETLFALLSGQADAMVYAEPVAWKVAREMGVDHRLKVVDTPLVEIKRAMSISKGNPELLARLDRAIAAFVESPQYREVYAKWYGRPEPFWNAPRVMWVMGAVLALSLATMAGWRQYSVLKLNRDLRQSEAALAKAQALANVGNWRWSIERDELISGSAEYARIHGVGPDEIHGLMKQQMDRVIHPEDRARFAEICRKADQQGLDYEIEYRIVRPDGEVRHVLEIGEAVFDAAGRPVEHVGTLQDITERKQAEHALQKNLTHLRHAQRIAKLDYWVWDPKTNRTTVSGGESSVIGASYDELCGMADEACVERYVHPDDRERVLKAYGPRPARNPTIDVEYRLVRPDGELRIIHEIGEPVLDDNGEMISQFGTFQDITEQKRIEERLRQSLEQLHHAQKIAKVSYWVWDAKANKVATPTGNPEVLGVSLLAVGGLSDEEYVERFVHPDDRERVLESYGPPSAKNPYIDIQYRIVRPDGEVRNVHELGEPVFDDGGQMIAQFGTLQDITEQKQAEEKIRRLNDELEQRVQARTAELQSAQEELLRNERLAALGQLTGTVSHELRNPLGAMRTAMATIKKLLRSDDPMLERSVELVERSILRCDNIISELLDYSRVRKLAPEPTALDGWLAGLLDEYEVPGEITLHLDLRAGAVAAFDHDRLRRVVVNLLDNACQAMADDGDSAADDGERLLTVATRQAEERVEISVSDTGPGIPAEGADKIFEPLYSTKAFGVGLGLAIVKQILEQHGGGIEIDRTAGRGVRMVVWLPLPVPLQRAAS